MTPKQAKQLKTGDEIFIRTKFLRNDGENNIVYSLTFRRGDCNTAVAYTTPEFALRPSDLQQPAEKNKYDPNRLFKAGDEVEYRPKDGRANPNLLVGRRYKVSVDEPCDSGIVQVECDGLRHIDTFVSYNNLELVIPVEELEPYFIMELKGAYGVYNTRFQPETEVCHFFTDMHPHAKEAAEAECARLNAEYRKEHE